MKNFKFLIIVFYYNRPELVKNALLSIKNSSYSNWEIAFIDDGSEILGKPIVESIFEDTSNITFYRSNDTVEDKVKRNGYQGSLMGMYAQEALKNSTSDYCLMLCDDDILVVDYLEKLNYFYNRYPHHYYSYCHIKKYDPTQIIPIEPFNKEEYHQNVTEPVCPYYKLDMSQVSFNIQETLKAGVVFPFPYTVNIDAEVFLKMYYAWGNIHFNGIDGQYKAIFEDNLMRRAGAVLGKIQTDEHVYNILLK